VLTARALTLTCECEDLTVDAPVGPAWSDACEEADWIGERLAPFNSYQVTSILPGGFDAYARILHPAEDPATGDRLVRWAEVAAWSGMPLRRDAQFHSVALPLTRPGENAPWSGQGPRPGTLWPADAAVLAEVLRAWTGTPEQCWFCLWDGYGWDNIHLMTPVGESPVRLPDPIPPPVRRGSRVHLPNRDYLLYAGPVEAVLETAGLAGDEQTANLWWPADHAWCVASEIDLAWTYVAGPAGLIERLVADERLETLPAGPEDPLTRVEDWITTWVTEATTSLFVTGEATITTSRGMIRAWLDRPTWYRAASLRTQSIGANGVNASSRHTLNHGGGQELRREVSLYLSQEVLELVGG
jgi:hypothetical protein